MKAKNLTELQKTDDGWQEQPAPPAPVEIDPDLAAEVPEDIGLPSWDRAAAVELLQRVANGETFRSCSKLLGVPPYRWARWLEASPKLREIYAIVRRLQSHVVVDEATDDARDNFARPRNDVANGALRLKQAMMIWLAGRLNPPEYGERATGEGSITVIINTNLPYPDRMAARVLPPEDTTYQTREYRAVAKIDDIEPEVAEGQPEIDDKRDTLTKLGLMKKGRGAIPKVTARAKMEGPRGQEN